MRPVIRVLNILGLLLTVGIAATAQSQVTFYEKDEAAPANAERLKTILITGNNPDRSCAEFELKRDAQDSAVMIGANLVKVVSERERTHEMPCDEITFAFYKVADLRAAERRFSWSAARPLAWTDFKGPVPAGASPTTVAETSCGIAVQTSTVIGNGVPRIYVYNTFQTYMSWVRDADSTADVLEHEQCHWDICELYTRKMRQRFAEAKIDVHNLQRVVGSIFNETQREYAARQQRYENDTRHGTIRDQQQRWTKMIAEELASTRDM